MSKPRVRGVLGLLSCVAGLTAGCHRAAPPGAAATPVVAVSQPVERQVTDAEEFTGRTDAVESVDVKARVNGYLELIGFRSGSVVKGDERRDIRVTATLGLVAAPLAPGPLLGVAAQFPGRGEGDLLFVIDRRPYQAALDQAAGQVQLSEARLVLAKADNARALELAKTPGAISKQDLDKYAAAQAEAQAQVVASKANMEQYRLNLEFCRITAPIDGQISRNYLTLGNLVEQDKTLLTTIVSEDPMYAYFDVDERTMLRVQHLIRTGKIRQDDRGRYPVYLGLANEAGFPHQGLVDFVNNKVDPNTGTITIRGVFPNPKLPVGPRLLKPGEFVRIRLPLGDPYKAVLVADRALASDQGQKYLLLVDDKNVVQYRRVKTGPLQEDGLRVIQEGLKPGEWVVVSGLQQVQPRMTVQVERVTMPVTGGADKVTR